MAGKSDVDDGAKLDEMRRVCADGAWTAVSRRFHNGTESWGRR